MTALAYIKTDDRGAVIEAGRAAEVPDGAVLVPGWRGDTRPLTRMIMTAQGQLVSRPLSPDVTSNGTQHTISGLSDGTVVQIIDVIGQEIMDEFTVVGANITEAITLPDTGLYDIVVRAPWPALPRTVRIAI